MDINPLQYWGEKKIKFTLPRYSYSLFKFETPFLLKHLHPYHSIVSHASLLT
jgi:hypothetical protein